MAKGPVAGDKTPARPPPALKKQNSSATSSKNQSSILGFFSKGPANGVAAAKQTLVKSNGSRVNDTDSISVQASQPTKKPAFKKAVVQSVTPVPSSDGPDLASSQEDGLDGTAAEVDPGLPSPSTPAKSSIKQVVKGGAAVDFSSPSRKVSTRLPCPT